jgi:4'-phosphopantetheinyl transferase EntD
MSSVVETPFGVLASLAVEDAASDRAALHDEERAFFETLAGARRATWLAGRLALRRALEAIAEGVGPILSDDRGAPSLPPHVRGSIAHKETVAVALAIRSTGEAHVGVGVDVEYDRPLRVDISRRVLTIRELAVLEGFSDADRDRVVRRAFAIKEAIYKAIDPLCRRYVGFREVELDLSSILTPGDVRANAALSPDPGPLGIRCAWMASEDATGAPLIFAVASAVRAH